MEARLFDPENPPVWLDSESWRDTDNCNHLDNRVHRARLEAAAETAVRAAKLACTLTIVDLGSGDGGMLSLLPEPYKSNSYGYEVIIDSVHYASANRGVDVRYANVLTDDLKLSDVAVMTEMLEHLEDPHGFLRKLYDPAIVQYIVVSSPHGETAEHHEWNHAWAWDREGYADMVRGAGWTILEQFDAEWSQIILAQGRPRGI